MVVGLVLAGLFLIALGLGLICGGVFDWDWWWNLSSNSRSWKVRLLPALLGRTGMRVFNLILGAANVLVGALWVYWGCRG